MTNNLKNTIYKILRWSEKYTKTDMVYLVQSGFWLSLGQGFSSLSSLLLSIAFANLIDKESFGTYKYVQSIASILALPTLSGMNTALIQSIARGYEGTLVPALKTKIAWGFLGAIGSISFAVYYHFNNNDILTIAFLIAAFFLPFMDSFYIYDSVLAGKKLFHLSSRYSIISQLTAVTIMTLTVFLTKNIYWIILAYFSTWTTLRFIFFKMVLKNIVLNSKVDKKAISFGKHLSAMNIIATVAAYIDRLLIFHYLGSKELAIYSIAIAPVEQMKGFMKNINTIALPKFSIRNNAELKKYLPAKLLKLGLFLGLIILVYILAAPILFKILFPKYSESLLLSQVFALSLIANISLIQFSILQAKQKTAKLYNINFIIFSIQIVLLWILIKYFGLFGAIIARLTARLLGTVITSLLIWK